MFSSSFWHELSHSSLIKTPWSGSPHHPHFLKEAWKPVPGQWRVENDVKGKHTPPPPRLLPMTMLPLMTLIPAGPGGQSTMNRLPIPSQPQDKPKADQYSLCVTMHLSTQITGHGGPWPFSFGSLRNIPTHALSPEQVLGLTVQWAASLALLTAHLTDPGMPFIRNTEGRF